MSKWSVGEQAPLLQDGSESDVDVATHNSALPRAEVDIPDAEELPIKASSVQMLHTPISCKLRGKPS